MGAERVNTAHAVDEGLSALCAAIGRAAARPLEEGTTMPPAAYTSPALLELEQRELFEKEWICLGRVEEVPKTGDYFTIRVADEPLLVVRANAGTIRVLSNVCRHKWSRVASGKGRAKRFVCPYHAWTYDLDGRLVHTRYMERTCGFDPSRIALPEIRSAIWRGFIYVNIDGNAPPLEERRAEIDERVGDYHMESMRRMCGDEEVWATNWKLLFENFTDLYHIFIPTGTRSASIPPWKTSCSRPEATLSASVEASRWPMRSKNPPSSPTTRSSAKSIVPTSR